MGCLRWDWQVGLLEPTMIMSKGPMVIYNNHNHSAIAPPSGKTEVELKAMSESFGTPGYASNTWLCKVDDESGMVTPPPLLSADTHPLSCVLIPSTLLQNYYFNTTTLERTWQNPTFRKTRSPCPLC